MTTQGKIVKVFCWTFGVAAAGAILGAKHSYAHVWYKALLGEPTFIVGGAVIGFLIGIAVIVSHGSR